MVNKVLYIIGITICIILLLGSLILIAVTSGEDGLAVKLILALFGIWMAWGIYRGVLKLIRPPKPSLNPTIHGVEYYPWHVPLRDVMLEFFNPLKMNFLTMGCIFVVGSFGIYTCLVGPRFMIAFFISLALLILLKSYLLVMTLKAEKLKNIYREDIPDMIVDDYGKYDVTEEMINADGTTTEDIIAPVRVRVNIYGTYDDYRNNKSHFTIEQQRILAITQYVSVMFGDGEFTYEFFTNPPGEVYIDAIDALVAIGAGEYADILKNAAEKFDGIRHPIYDTDRRTDIIDDSDISFEDDDDAFWALDPLGENIEALMMDYIRKHPSKFIFKQP